MTKVRIHSDAHNHGKYEEVDAPSSIDGFEGVEYISFLFNSMRLKPGYEYRIEHGTICVYPTLPHEFKMREANVENEDDTDWQQIALDLSVAIQEFAHADEQNRNSLAARLTAIRNACPAD